MTVLPLPAAGASHDPIVEAATSGRAFVLAEFGSDTCPACEQMLPVVRSVVARYPDLIHQVHDADRQAELAKKYQVRCVPVYVVVDPEGQVRFNDVGLFTSEELDEILRETGAVGRPSRGN
jgi:thiol-disulfide isomerase/thioredoxin